MNRITGWFSYEDNICQQHPQIWDKLKILFDDSKPAQVLEVGTSHGGLTLLIRDLLDDINLPLTPLRSYDINPNHNRNKLLQKIEEGINIDFRLKNIFNQPYSELAEVEEVEDYIQRPGTTVVMCDGGSKKNEFRILAPLLKPGDIIMAHDYAPNKEYFEKHIKNKIWNWHEIGDKDIELTCNEYSLHSFLQDELQEVVWVCKKKAELI